MPNTLSPHVTDHTVALVVDILAEIARIRRMHGYTQPDDNGIDASVWLGTSLHTIEDAALAILTYTENN
jgi:hypothetical protein